MSTKTSQVKVTMTLFSKTFAVFLKILMLQDVNLGTYLVDSNGKTLAA
jgi:hypothetical protein